VNERTLACGTARAPHHKVSAGIRLHPGPTREWSALLCVVVEDETRIAKLVARAGFGDVVGYALMRGPPVITAATLP
jgi:hypothetical protein